jgi:hypothetical protein
VVAHLSRDDLKNKRLTGPTCSFYSSPDFFQFYGYVGKDKRLSLREGKLGVRKSNSQDIALVSDSLFMPIFFVPLRQTFVLADFPLL